MIIGIDGFRLMSEPKTSGAVYVSELVASWAALPQVKKTYVFVPREPSADFQFNDLTQYPNVQLVFPEQEVYPETSFRSQMKWIQVVLPSLVRRRMLDLDYFVAPYHHTPIRIPNRTRVVTVIHDTCGLQYSKRSRGLYRHLFMFATAFLRSDRLICISNHTRGEVIRLLPFLASRIAGVVHNGLAASTLGQSLVDHVLAQRGIDRGNYFLWIGALSARKGFDLLLDGLKEYRRLRGSASLVVVVNKDAVPQVRQLVAEYGVDQVLVLTQLDAMERDALYQGAAAVLFPSRCEGFGYPVVEAMRQGCPTIAWEQGPAKELTGGLQPLLCHLEPEEMARLMVYYESMPRGEREELAAKLIRYSESFSAALFGKRFLQTMTDMR